MEQQIKQLDENGEEGWPSEYIDIEQRAAFRKMLLQNASHSAPLPAQRTSKAVFDKSVQSAYTHGLEHIYALENVDPASIRRIQIEPEGPSKKTSSVRLNNGSSQLIFDFGRGYRTWMEPLVLHEPITVLGLSHHAEKLLSDAGRLTIAGVVDLEGYHVGLGQGHIDEIRNKVKAYLAGKSLDCDDTLDIQALLRTMLRFCDLRAAFVLLQDFQLEHICPLPVSAAAEVRRSNGEKLNRWRDEAIDSWCSVEASAFFRDRMSEALEAFIAPWVIRRGGVSTEAEVSERLHRAARDEMLAQPFLLLVKKLYGGLQTFLQPMVHDLYCSECWMAREVALIVECVRGYFYRFDVFYPYQQLIDLVRREMSRQWFDPPELLLEKILILCPQFHVRMDASFGRIVRLA